MQQVRVHGPADVRVDQVDDLAVGPADAIVRIAACGICGTDLKYIKLGFSGPGGSPMPLGHEMAGVVEAVGSGVTSVAVGDRVVVHPGNDELGRIGNGSAEGGLAPRLLVRVADAPDRLYRVPDELELGIAALAEPLSVGINAVAQADAGADDSVVIFGGGPIGLAALAALVDAGNEQTVVVDFSEARLALARRMGAQAALSPTAGGLWKRLRELHGSAPFTFGPTPGTDVYIEASGAASVIGDVLAHARPNSRMSVVALHMDDIPVSFLSLLMKQFTIRGAMEYPQGLQPALDLLGRRDLSALITHRFALGQFDDALAMLSGSRDCGKVMITFDEDAG